MVLGSISLAYVARLTRTTMLEAQTADHVRTVDFLAMTRRAIGQRRVNRGHTLAGSVDSRFGPATRFLCITCAQIASKTATAKKGAGHFVEDDMPRTLFHQLG